MITDHIHFKTKDGIVFTTRGFYHPANKVRAIPLYRLSTNNKYLEKSVDEFGNKWFSQVHPKWVQESSFGKGIFVPVSEISEIYDPFKSEKIIQGLEDETSIQIIAFLESLSINKSNIGFLGSYLFDTGKKPSDIDFVIRGLDNLILIKKSFGKLLENIQGQDSPTEEYVKNSIPRYEEKYNKKFNDFTDMIKRRWPTIYVQGKFFGKLRFTYKRDEVPVYEFPQGNPITNLTLTGKVISDVGTNFMPRNFIMNSDEKTVKVFTYFWDFSYCVKERDNIKIRGDYFPKNQTFLISNPKYHGIIFNN